MEIAFLAALLVLSPPQAKQGQALLDQSYQRVKSAKSLTMESVMSGGTQKSTAKIAILRGGYLRVTSDGFEQIATPETTWFLMRTQKQYVKQPSQNKAVLLSAAPGFESLLSSGTKLVAKSGVVSSTLGQRSTKRVQFESPGSGIPGSATQYLHIDPKTSLPAGVSVEVNGQKFQIEYRNIKLGAPLTAKSFAWAPPSGWQEANAGGPQGDLLKVGTKAPAFTVNTPAGKKTSLAEAMKGKKATLVNFWFYG